MEALHAIQELLQVIDCVLLRNNLLLLQPQFLEVSLYIILSKCIKTIAVFHHQIAIILALQVLDQLHHILVVTVH
jgi:hypothetical protein